MTNREAIHILQNSRLTSEYFTEEGLTAAYVMAIAALEKQEPMKPRLNYEPPKVSRKLLGEESAYTCAHCGNVCLKRCSATRNETFIVGIAVRNLTGRRTQNEIYNRQAR